MLHVALNQALDLALELDAGEARYQCALWTLLPQFMSNQLIRAAENIGKVRGSKTRAWACASLARQLTGEPKLKVLASGVEAALAIPDELDQANALAQLGDQLTGEVLEQALQATLAMENEQWRPRVLVKLAGQLNAIQQVKALDGIIIIQHPWYRAFALVGLIPYLTGILFARAQEAALSVESDEARAFVLTRLSFSQDVIPRVLDIAMGIGDEKYRFEALVGLIPQLQGDQKLKVLDLALQLVAIPLADKPYTLYRYPYLMTRLAAEDGGAERAKLLSDALETILQISDEEDRGYALEELVGHLPDDLMPRALVGMLAFHEDFRRIRLLGTIAQRLPINLLKQALTGSSIATDYDARARVLMRLSRVSGGAVRAKALQYALRASLTIQAPWEQIEPLSRLLGELDDPQRAEVTTHALEIALTLPNHGDKVDRLMALLPYLPAQQREQIFAIARDLAAKIDDTENRSSALVALAVNTEGTQKEELLTLALEEALKISKAVEPYIPIYPLSEQTLRAAAVAHVATHLTGELLTRALLFFQQNVAPFWTLRMILERPFTAQQLEMAFGLAHQIANEGCRAEALAILARSTSGDERTKLLTQILEQAKTEPDSGLKFRILILLVEQLNGSEQAQVVDLALEAIQQQDEQARLDSLLQLLPFTRNHEQLVREIRKAVVDVLESCRSKPREDLLYSLDDRYFAPSIFPSSITATLVDHIITVCWLD